MSHGPVSLHSTRTPIAAAVGEVSPVSVTMFGKVYNDGLAPTEEEIASGRAQDYGGAQPRIVRHKH